MIKHIVNGKVLIAALVIAFLLLAGSVVIILLSLPAPEAGMPVPISAALTIISAPTGTPRNLPPTLTSLPPTPTLPPTAAPGQFGLGIYVQVDTGGDALRFRAEPGLDSAPLFLAYDAEAFLITDGPREADGYTWWYLSASYDAARQGWAAQNFLVVIPSP